MVEVRVWPEGRGERLRVTLLLALLVLALFYAAYRVKVHFGFGQGSLRPTVQGEVPERTPLPRAPEELPKVPVRTTWQTLAVSAKPGEPARGRGALWVVPEGLAEKPPLVVVMHGDGGDARGFHEHFTYEEASGAWAVLVYPEGIARGWDTESPRDNKDIAFLDALIDTAQAVYGVDPARVYLTGYSSGGFLAHLYACQRSDKVRAIATHEAGAPYNQAEKWPNGSPKCPGQKPVAVLAAHGQNDMAVSFRSGEYSARYWAAVNACKVQEGQPTAYSQCYAYAGCPADKPVVFCDIPNLGHWIWDQGAAASVRFFQRLEEG